MSEGLCAARVRDEGFMPRYHPCNNKATRDGFCGIHHPDKVKARRENAAQKSRATWDKQDRLAAYRFMRKADKLDLIRLNTACEERLLDLSIRPGQT